MIVPPIVMVGMDITYFLLLSLLCFGIYWKTRDVYSFTKLKTVFHFRNIFLYFALAYGFRLLYVIYVLSNDFGMRMLMDFQLFGLLVVSYFSTMAILSVAMTVVIKKIPFDNDNITTALHLIAILSLTVVFFARSFDALLALHTIVLAVSVLAMFLRKPSTHFSRQNRITYLLLFVFWVINLLQFSRGPAMFEMQAGIYIVSLGIFASIYLRVNKRLKDAEKKKPPRDNK